MKVLYVLRTLDPAWGGPVEGVRRMSQALIGLTNGATSVESRRNGVRFVHWVQDIYSLAIEFFLRSRFSELAASLSMPFRVLEKRVCSASDAIIVIAPAFRDRLVQWSVAPSKVTVLENWAPLEEMDRCLVRMPGRTGTVLRVVRFSSTQARWV